MKKENVTTTLYIFKCRIDRNFSEEEISLKEKTLRKIDVRETEKMFSADDWIIPYSLKISKEKLDSVIDKWQGIFIISRMSDINYFEEILNDYLDKKITGATLVLLEAKKRKEAANSQATQIMI